MTSYCRLGTIVVAIVLHQNRHCLSHVWSRQTSQYVPPVARPNEGYSSSSFYDLNLRPAGNILDLPHRITPMHRDLIHGHWSRDFHIEGSKGSILRATLRDRAVRRGVSPMRRLYGVGRSGEHPNNRLLND